MESVHIVNYQAGNTSKYWEVLTDAKCFARDLANTRADQMNTVAFLNEAEQVAGEFKGKITLTKIVGDDLLKEGLNLIHAVGRGRGKEAPPVLVNLEYRGNPDSNEWHAMVGKGVVFDAGGLTIKMNLMETMHQDKGGASAVLAAMRGIVQLGLKLNITCSIPLAENSINSNSVRPSDIIKSHKGLTVEILNTDAEGRLILCDAMSWTQKKYGESLKTMIELSTLTGAGIVGLGERFAGLYSNDQGMVDMMKKTALEVGELLWHMVIGDHCREQMKGKESDLLNSDLQRFGGAQKAAAYLENFVEDHVNWVHIDMAGTGMVFRPYLMHENNKGSGFGAATLINTFLKMAN